MSRPPPIRLDDLAEPRFPEEIKPVREFMAEMASDMHIEPKALMDAAREQTGLDDFGAPDFEERLDVLCEAFRTEAGLGPVGVVGMCGLLTQLLKNRLLIEDLVKRHPEILDVRIVAPIIICGLPRTGTTHLHNLMSADPNLRSLPYWESLEPVLSESDAGADPDPRIARTEQALWFVNAAMPEFKRMHEMTVEHVHEEIQLLAIDFSSMLFETTAPMPTWHDYYRSHDQTPSYAYLRKVLQVLQWLRGGTRWVLKSPQHIEQFGPLRATFPDATFVVTHRDPVSVTASTTTMLAYSARMSHDRVDPVRVGHYWAARLEEMLRDCVRDHDLLPDDQTIDVHFAEFMSDDVAMVERIYSLAGQPMKEDVRAAMDVFMTAHPRGRHGTVLYDLEVLGLDRARLRDSLQFYVDSFSVALESSGG